MSEEQAPIAPIAPIYPKKQAERDAWRYEQIVKHEGTRKVAARLLQRIDLLERRVYEQERELRDLDDRIIAQVRLAFEPHARTLDDLIAEARKEVAAMRNHVG